MQLQQRQLALIWACLSRQGLPQMISAQHVTVRMTVSEPPPLRLGTWAGVGRQSWGREPGHDPQPQHFYLLPQVPEDLALRHTFL